MAQELGKITLYLSKSGQTFESVIEQDKIPNESSSFQVRIFNTNDCDCKFFCQQVTTNHSDNPTWLDFVNEKVAEEESLNFSTKTERPSGLLLINVNNRLLVASFGVRGASWIKKSSLEFDFGIKVAMNLCGNEEVREAKSSVHTYNTQMIDRQLSQPSNSFEFGMGETEFLQYISAHLLSDKKVTLQGKDSLTIKVIGDDKLSWERLIQFCSDFVDVYDSEDYKELFPNYPNLEPVNDEKLVELEEELIKLLKEEDFSKIHLAIPEFIADDEFSFSYSNYSKRKNIVVSHIQVEDLKDKSVFNGLDDVDISKLNAKYIYAYSHDEEKILSYRKWSIYDCLISEIEIDGSCYVLSGGQWRKVDDDFYTSVNDFIDNTLIEHDVSDDIKDIDIFCNVRNQNREEKFNQYYCRNVSKAFLFDQAKLKIGYGRSDNEFCDIFELDEESKGHIIHVKRESGSSALNHLFSQARFYCEFFLSDSVFLSEIRSQIENSQHENKVDLLSHINPVSADVNGSDYTVKLWVLYDNRKEKPLKSGFPLMAKYELKLAYEKLRNTMKYSEVSISMIPVSQTRAQVVVQNDG